MRRLLPFLAVAGLALALAGSVSGATSKRYVTDCADAVQHPKSIILLCGDANEYLRALTWKSWGAATTTATGKLGYVVCDPDCASGYEKTVPVNVTLSGTMTCKGKKLYARMELAFPKGLPPKNSDYRHRTGTYKLVCPFGR